MTHSLTFETLHHYDAGQPGITVPIVLSLLWAKLDSGSTYCIFEREVGEALGLDIESGRPEWIGTVTGRFKACGHDVTLLALGYQFDVAAYFAEKTGLGRSTLGRYGWMNQLALGIVDYEGKLYVGEYNADAT